MTVVLIFVFVMMVMVLLMFQLNVLKAKDINSVLIKIIIQIKLTFDTPVSVVGRFTFCGISLKLTVGNRLAAFELSKSRMELPLLERLFLFSFFISVV
jgi:hypothetical protein